MTTGVRAGRAGWARVWAVAAATALLATLAGPAAAHNFLRATDPAADSTVAHTPGAIVLTFDEPALAMGTQVVVAGPGGAVQAGSPRLVDETLTQDLQPGSPAGRYTVQWRVTSADGHPITGTFSFTSQAAGAGGATSGPPGSASEDEPPSTAPVGSAGWLPIVAGLVVLLAAVVIVANVRRTRPRSGT